jgi:hypothetical protein
MHSVAVVCAVAFVIPTAYGFVAESICFDFLCARIANENVIVRKPPSDFVVDLIASRTRDLAVLVRQDAARFFCACLDQSEDPALIKMWFDAIVAFALDTDPNAQELALGLCAECVFTGLTRTACIGLSILGRSTSICFSRCSCW